jgi:hypothetical protein
VAGDAGGGYVSFTQTLVLPAYRVGTLPPPPINFCSPGFDYTMNVLWRGVIADLMGVNGRLALSQVALPPLQVAGGYWSC